MKSASANSTVGRLAAYMDVAATDPEKAAEILAELANKPLDVDAIKAVNGMLGIEADADSIMAALSKLEDSQDKPAAGEESPPADDVSKTPAEDDKAGTPPTDDPSTTPADTAETPPTDDTLTPLPGDPTAEANTTAPVTVTE
jgi:hypothetical protein